MAVLLTLVGLSGLLGCSEYRDPYTGICPSIEDLEIRSITATTAHVFWRSDHLMISLVKYRPDDGPERIFRGTTRAIEHDILLENLFPTSRYRVTLVKDIGGPKGEDREDQVIACGADVETSFVTKPLRVPAPTTGIPVPDPNTPVNP
jgi:hypothetical protein